MRLKRFAPKTISYVTLIDSDIESKSIKRDCKEGTRNKIFLKSYF